MISKIACLERESNASIIFFVSLIWRFKSTVLDGYCQIQSCDKNLK